MIRLGTAFSGIGAIEQALERMNLEHEILFAIDNGNIVIDINEDEELSKIKSMNTIKEKLDYANGLYKKKTRRTNFVEITYLENYKVKDNNFFYDIKLFDGEDFHKSLDLFVGGSPCQSFSMVGSRGGFEDTRGTLFYDYVRLVKEIQPKVFIYENVFGLLNHDKGRTWATVQNVFEELGYHYKWQVLDSRDYGIPQGRRRIFVVGFKNEKYLEKFDFPATKELEFTMQDFLIDNCSIGNFKSVNGNIKIKRTKGIPDDKLFLSEKLLAYVLSPGTKNFYHPNGTKTDLPIARAILSTQGNSHRASVNNYVTTDGRLRALDPRESLRLMGFPDTFKVPVSKAQSYKQSGNSIVVDVLINIMESIMKTGVFENGKN
ncbi:DNA cytosine methyltransferase [Haploplasma modicum]|uniref:DNA cytosine methyltransferase n=1 Tax=Haploplasma modicum TaxID=2150 RepID=UPI00138B0C33|nr:DNA (cytosine-5-)-methyltransferase [Haploplasma modicum]